MHIGAAALGRQRNGISWSWNHGSLRIIVIDHGQNAWKDRLSLIPAWTYQDGLNFRERL